MDDRAARLGLKRDTKVSPRRPWIIVLVLVLLGLAVWGAATLVFALAALLLGLVMANG